MKNKVRAFLAQLSKEEKKRVIQTYQLLKGRLYFKRNSKKVLGEVYQTTNQFAEMVTKIKGNREDAIAAIKVKVPEYIQEILNTASDVPEIHNENSIQEQIKQLEKEMETLTIISKMNQRAA